MTPDFRIIADSEDITERIRNRLLSFRVTDEAGTKSDAVELALDDREAVLVWPSPGAELEVSLGYRETGLTRLGLYVVDEVEHSGPPNTLTIRAKATNMRASLKAPKTRAWDNIKLGNLVATMASEHGLSPKVSGGLSTVVIPHLDQTAESDLHLLTRLARLYGAVTKPVAGNLIFVVQGEAKSASGRELTEVAVPPSHVIQHRMTLAERGSYQSAVAYCHDTESAKKLPVSVGNGEPKFTLRHTYPDAEQAIRAAETKLAAIKRGTGTLSLTLLGNAELMAEGKLSLAGIRDEVNGQWLITRVEHQFDGQGYVTRCQAEILKT